MSWQPKRTLPSPAGILRPGPQPDPGHPVRSWCPRQALGAGGVIHLQVTGQAGLPAAGVGAVVLNVTVTGASNGGYLTVYPTGVSRPNASTLSFAKGATIHSALTANRPVSPPPQRPWAPPLPPALAINFTAVAPPTVGTHLTVFADGTP